MSNSFDQLLQDLDYANFLGGARACKTQCTSILKSGVQCKQCAIDNTTTCYAHTRADTLTVANEFDAEFPQHYKKYAKVNTPKPIRFYYEDDNTEHKLLSQLLREIKAKCRHVQIPFNTLHTKMSRVYGNEDSNRFIVLLHVSQDENTVIKSRLDTIYGTDSIQYFYPEYLILTNVTIKPADLTSDISCLKFDVYSPYVNTGQYPYFYLYIVQLIKIINMRSIFSPVISTNDIREEGLEYTHYKFRIGIINKVDEYGPIITTDPQRSFLDVLNQSSNVSAVVNPQLVDLRPLAAIAIIKSLSTKSLNIKEHYYINLEDNVMRFLYTKSLVSFKHIDVPNSNIFFGDFIPEYFTQINYEINTPISCAELSVADITNSDTGFKYGVNGFSYPLHYNLFDDHRRHQIEHRSDYVCEAVKNEDATMKQRATDIQREYSKYFASITKMLSKSYSNIVDVNHNPMQQLIEYVKKSLSEVMQDADEPSIGLLANKLHGNFFTHDQYVTSQFIGWQGIITDDVTFEIPLFSSYIALLCNGRRQSTVVRFERYNNTHSNTTGYKIIDGTSHNPPFDDSTFPTSDTSSVFANLLNLNKSLKMNISLQGKLIAHTIKNILTTEFNASYIRLLPTTPHSYEMEKCLNDLQLNYFGTNCGGYISSFDMTDDGDESGFNTIGADLQNVEGGYMNQGDLDSAIQELLLNTDFSGFTNDDVPGPASGKKRSTDLPDSAPNHKKHKQLSSANTATFPFKHIL